jgi:hypothetical protein
MPTDDPILTAIQRGGVAVADDDPILSAIQGTTSAGPKKSRAASPKVSAASAAKSDPILAAILRQDSDLRTPSLDELATGTSPETQAPSLTDRAATVGRSMLPLTPPSMDITQIPRNVFTGGAQQPGMATEEETAREGMIGPSPIKATGNVFLPGRNPNATLEGNEPLVDPSRGLLAPQNLMTETEQRQHPVLTGLGELGEGLTTPENLAFLAGTWGVGSLAGAGAKTLKQLISAGFTAQMLVGAGEKYPEIADAIHRGDTYNAKRLLTHAIGGVVLAGAASRGMLEEPPSPFAEKGAISGPLAMDEGTAHARQIVRDLETHARVNAPVNIPKLPETTEQPPILQGPPQGPEPNPLHTEAERVREQQAEQTQPGLTVIDRRRVSPEQPEAPPFYEIKGAVPRRPPGVIVRPSPGETISAPTGRLANVIGAGESLAPETPKTLGAQVDALANGTNKAVYFPKGQKDVPEAPDDATVTEIKGNQPGSGTWYHSDDITPQQIRAAVKDGSYPQLLGYTQPKEQAVAAGKPTAVVARHADGTELKAGLVDSSNPQAVAEQAAEFARQFPQSKIGVESPESVIASRKGVTPPASRRTSQIESQLGTDAILDAIRGTAAAAPTTESINFRQKQQPLAERFSPATLEEARQELTAAHQLASSFDQPGRYFSSVGQTEEMIPQRSQSSAKGIQAGGTWYGVSSSRHIVADQFPWYGEIEQGPARIGKLIEKGKGAEYERLLATVAESIQREKQSAAPVIAEYSPRLRELSDKIDGNDQELSDSLAQLASADGRGFKNLRDYIQGKIHDADEAHTFYALVDKAATEARQTGAAKSPESRGELRSGESEHAAEPGESKRPESTVAGHPPLSETAETPASAESLEQGALPGLETAIEEQKRGAARVQGEHLSEEANRPLGSIEQSAGEMERTSPLFRDTEANPQSDLFKSKPLEKTPAVGDRIQPSAGPLKGKTLEVTKIGETGVYARAEENGPIKFVKNGEFEAVRYSGIHPKVLIEGARVLQRAWGEKIAQPFIDRVLKIGDKYRAAREADPAVAEGLHLLDNAPTYLRAKATQVVKDVIGNLSRAQERLFTLMADADSRENLKLNHPEEFLQAQNDSAIQAALKKYKPLEQELTGLREKMGGQTLEQDYLRRVYDKYVAGVNKAEVPGTPERGTSAFDRVIRPQRTDKLSRESTSEYHYENGLHEFGPAFATKFIGTHLKALRDQVAREFLDKSTMLPAGASEQRFIEYNGQRYYRPDVAKDLRDAGSKDVKVYDRYDPTAGEKFPVPADGKFLGPRELVKTLTDFGRREEGEPGALRRFFQEQIIGFGFGIPHVANIMRRVSQTVAGGAVNPQGWARAWKVVLSKELRDRGISGLDDPTFDMLAKHGAISTGEVSNLKAYMGGNLNPANWARALAQVGHKFLFEPTGAKGFGGLDQRARLYIADLIQSQRPDLSEAKIAEAVRTQLGDYNRTNWTDQQKMLSKFMMFPGWDFSSIRWVLQHPVKTTVPPALMVLLANRTLNYFGQNREEDRDDISNIHIGDRSYGTSLLRESVARNLFRPAIAFAQSKMRGESNQRAMDAASRGITAGAGGLLSMLRPDLSGFLALATNRQGLFSGKEIVSAKDYDTPGKILPSKALEKQAVFTVRHALPALDRMFDSGEDVDMKSFVGGNLGVPNYRDDAEKRLIRNAAEANRVYSNISTLAKANPQQAVEMLKDPDNAAYALFHHDLQGMTTALHKIDQVREAVNASTSPDAEKQSRLKALDNARQMFLGHADGLNNLLFKRRTELRGAIPTTAPSHPSMIPLMPTARASGVPFRPPAQR